MSFSVRFSSLSLGPLALVIALTSCGGTATPKIPVTVGKTTTPKPPQSTFLPAPSYPAELRKAGLGAKVELQITVNESGAVEAVKVLKSTHPLATKAAVDAVRQWTFEPGERFILKRPINFSLGGEPSEVHEDKPEILRKKLPFSQPVGRYEKIWADNREYLGLVRDWRVTQLPEKNSSPGRPTYTSSAGRQSNDARVVVSCVIDEKGRVEAARVVSTTHPEAVSGALREVRRQTYRPALGLYRIPRKVLWEEAATVSAQRR